MLWFRSWGPLVLAVGVIWLFGDGVATAGSARVAPPPCPNIPKDTTANAWAATKQRLLPRGATELRLCSYKSKVIKSRAVLTQRLLTAARPIRSLVTGLDGLTSTPPPPPPGALPGSSSSCPGAFTPAIAIFAAYRGHAAVELLMDEARCQMVTNIHLTRYFSVDQPVIRELNTLIAGGSTAHAAAVPATCPDRIRRMTLASSATTPRSELLPADPRSLLFCWYEPDLPPSEPHRLEHQVRVGRGRTLADVLRELRALSPKPPGSPGRPVMCPADLFPNVLIFASYAHRAAVELLLDKTGCATVTNGAVTRYFDVGPAPGSPLQRLLPWSELPSATRPTPAQTTAPSR